MKKLFLASSIDKTAGSIAKNIGRNPKKLKLAFIYTAGEIKERDADWINQDRKGLVDAGFDLFDYTITDKSKKQFDRDLGSVDIIHVNGGNTFYLLLQSRKSGFDKWIVKAVNKGKIYIGSSAGSIIASPNIEITKRLDTKLYERQLKNFESFDLVDFVCLPHWGSDHFKELYLNKRLKLAYKPENKIILLNDWQYVIVEDNNYRIVDIRGDEVDS